MRDHCVTGHKIRGLRIQAGLRTAELAQRLGCTEGHLRNIEGGRDQPGDLLAHDIVRALAAQLDRALTLDDITTHDHALA